jgi:hypothetical protein
MATTFTSNYAASTYFAAGHGFGNNLKAATGSYALTAALVVDDIIQMVKVPAGATVLDVLVKVPDLDSGGSPAITLDVGYGGDDDYWIAAATTGQAGGLVRATATTTVPLAFTAEDTIDIHVDTAPQTGATTGTLYLTVFYTMP